MPKVTQPYVTAPGDDTQVRPVPSPDLCAACSTEESLDVWQVHARDVSEAGKVNSEWGHTKNSLMGGAEFYMPRTD